MKSGSRARNRKRGANERGGTPFADGYYRSLPPALSQLDARYFRRPSSFGQSHCTGSSIPFFLSLSFFLALWPSFLPRETRFARKRPPRRDTPHHYLPGEILARSLMKRESRGSEPATPSQFRHVFSRIIGRFHCAWRTQRDTPCLIIRQIPSVIHRVLETTS